MGWMRDETGLGKRDANYVPLTPLSHLQRAALIFADREALVYGETRLSYGRYYRRVSRLASALTKVGVEPGDVVATLLPNVPAQSEATFGVPACGAVLNTINTRLDVDTVAYIFDHGEAKVALVDSQFLPLAMAAIDQMEGTAPLVIEVPDELERFVARKGSVCVDGTSLTVNDVDGNAFGVMIIPHTQERTIIRSYSPGTRVNIEVDLIARYLERLMQYTAG